uniref:Uncharacterized protein n=1 Tax=Trichinella nativa TaxID=6335 RepID=A0A0V1KJV0_9BILA
MHYLCLIFHDYPLSRHNPGLIFHFFLDLSPYSKSYRVFFSILTFFTVSRHFPGPTILAIIQDQQCVMQCLCFIFHVFLFSRYTPDPTVCISHFSCFSLFLAIFQILPCEFLIFIVCQFFRRIPYHKCYLHKPGATLCISQFSCSSFFTVSRHSPVPTVVSHHIPAPNIVSRHISGPIT